MGRRGKGKAQVAFTYEMIHAHKYTRDHFDLCALVWIWICDCGRWFAKR